ncbi:hypothetical protein ACHAXA_005196 [Cyclostephanos tholiformis]|uniref:PPM-type phosphatase domain-containing protein n=1 Tax=Cyclostephanos tholiformis TaxID=382380 RepID=A0ABD3RSQ7_9STRA
MTTSRVWMMATIASLVPSIVYPCTTAPPPPSRHRRKRAWAILPPPLVVVDHRGRNGPGGINAPYHHRVRRGGDSTTGSVEDAAATVRGSAIDCDDDDAGCGASSSVGMPSTPPIVVPPSPSLSVGAVTSMSPPRRPPSYSAWSVRGERRYMEDEYFAESAGGGGVPGGITLFAAVFDGHGGSAVSRYLRQNLYASFQAALPSAAASSSSSSSSYEVGGGGGDDDVAPIDDERRPTMRAIDRRSSIVASALEAALDKVDTEVGNISHWSFQGSTALAIVVHENDDAKAGVGDDGGGGGGGGCEGGGSRSIVVANVGDSRAVLCRAGRAMDLTRDHKPNDDVERRRIEGRGGTVEWCGEVDDATGRPVRGAGVYRINGNLALSRSIGDRAERPWVIGTADIFHHVIDEDDDAFVLLATDGLFDVMSSREAVSFVNDLMGRTHPEDRLGMRRNVARYVVEEAIRRGTCDNVTVLIVWFDDDKLELSGANPKTSQ